MTMMQHVKIMKSTKGGDYLWVRKALCCALVGIIAGCALGPDYVKPKINVPTDYKENKLWKVAEPAQLNPKDPWWTVYRDAKLNELMDILNKESPTLAEAEAAHRQTEALLREAQAGMFPTVSASAGKTRAVSSGGAAAKNTYSLGLSASWEVDLWGELRRAVEAGKATLEEEDATLAATKLSTQATLATAYLELRVADKQIKQLTEYAKSLEETLRITENQYKAGVVTDADVASARSSLKSAQVSLISEKLTRDQLEHAVAVSIGRSPADFHLDVSDQDPYLPMIPAGLPSELLLRRPDIVEAERAVAVANAKIGIAEAAFYPSLTLSASGGYSGSSFSNLVSLPNRIWSIGPELALTVFDGGLRKAEKDAAVAVYDQAVASYRATVLSAFQAVEDNLVTQGRLKDEADLQAEALAAAKRAEEIAINQYKAGTVTYLSVLTAQNTRITAQNTEATILNSRYSASVSLISAIGGRW